MSFLLVLALIAGLPLVPRSVRIVALLPVTVFQVYLPGLAIGDAPTSLAFILAYSFWPDAIREARVLINFRPMLILVALVGVTLISFFWSVDLHLGLAALASLLAFPIVFAGFTSQCRRNALPVLRGIRLMVLAGLVFAFSVVVFRLLPLVKMGFLGSPLASIFINANMLADLFLDGKNNVFDPLKSGGFGFVNANAASCEIGMLAMIAQGMARAYKDRFFGLSSVALLATIPFTGSKAGDMLVVLMLALMVLLYLMRKGGRALGIVATYGLILVFLCAGLIGPFESRGAAGTFGGDVQGTTDTRLLIWEYAAKTLINNPIFGQGFGGWQATFPSYARMVGLSENLPPHNTFLYLWSQSGLLAMLLGLGFAITVLKRSFAQTRHVDEECRGLALALGMSFLWLTAQGLGENMGLLGDTHMAPAFAAMLALFRMRLGAFRAGDESCHA